MQMARRFLVAVVIGLSVLAALPTTGEAQYCYDIQCWTCVYGDFGTNCAWVSRGGSCGCWNQRRVVNCGQGCWIITESCQQVGICYWLPY